MEKNVTFRHCNGQHPGLNDMALESLDKFQKYYDKIIKGEVIFNNEKVKQVEIKLQIKDASFFASDKSDEFKKSLASAANKMERQIKKHKSKIMNN